MPIKGSSFKQLSKENRVRIEVLNRNGWSNAEVAKRLGIHRATVGRELRNPRNHDVRGKYDAEIAWQTHIDNKACCGATCKRLTHQGLVDFVCEQLIKKKWSPDVSIQFAKDRAMFQRYFTARSVYNWIKDGIIAINECHMRFGLRRGKRRKAHENKTKLGKSIELRPPEVGARTEFGHWEGDCILDEYHNAILVMQERTTRRFEMKRLEKLNSSNVYNQISKWISQHGAAIKSITFDNGSEFARAHELKADTYFTHPYAPHEKGGVENLNGRLRWDLPKGASLNRYTAETLQQIQDNINSTPRRILNYKTPSELFDIFSKNANLSRSRSLSLCCN
jgi:IS30 family transposase